MATSFTVREIHILIKQLEDENCPANDELIDFYKKRIREATIQEIEKRESKRNKKQ